jgi:PAS domain S-box-containing protein
MGQAHREEALRRDVAQSAERQDEIVAILLFANAAETGQRGFLLTSDKEYLAPYLTAKDHIPVLIERLGAQVHKPAQQGLVRHLALAAESKLSEMAWTLKLANRGDAAGALQVVRSGQGERDMADLRLAANAAIAGEDAELADRTQALDHSTRRTKLFAGALLTVMVLIAAGAGGLIVVALRERDLSNRRLATAHHTAVEAQARYRHLADTARDAIIRIDPGNLITFISPASSEILGYSPAELVGSNMQDLINPDDIGGVEAAYCALIAAGPDAPSVRLEFRARHRDGHCIWLEGSPRVEFDPATGQVAGYQDMMRDATARKRLEAELATALAAAEEAAAVKAEFLANMSHELRTPMTSVLGFSKLLLERDDLSPEARLHVERVDAAGKALLATVNDILDFSKLEAGQVEIVRAPMSIRPLLDETLTLFLTQAERKGLALAAQVAAAVPEALLADQVRLRQILLNLIGNAVKFTAAGQVAVALTYVGGALRCEISDTGPGMTPDQAARLFQRFSQIDGGSTRKHGGTGLGLAICRGLVEAMGGIIGVDSVPGAGSTFWFQLPAAPAPAPSLEVPAAAAVAVAGLRVLVVDDAEMNRTFARLVLSAAGVEVDEAADGQAAVIAAEANPYDVILMDLHMGEMDGETAGSLIRAGTGPNARIPILAFTASGSRDAWRQAPVHIFNGQVNKPVSPRELIEAVIHWSGQAEQAPQDRARA